MTELDKKAVIIGGSGILMCLLYIRFLLSDLSMTNLEWGLFGLLFLISTTTFLRSANK